MVRSSIAISAIFSLFLGFSAMALELPDANCNESVFKPCVCASQAPKDIKYRPSYAACGGKAAVILTGEFANSFSVVLRDRQNRDRFPAVGFNGCSAAQANLGLAKCSAYKCQKVTRRKGVYTCCFGGSGKSKILSKTSRMTLKLRDVPTSSSDPLLRVCLPLFSPKYPMN